MRIVLDIQGAQSESRFRGIGRYTMAFAQAVARNRGQHEVILVLNGLFSDTIEPIRVAFADLLPQDNILVWSAPGPVCEEQGGNDKRRQVAELAREAFIASLNPDIVHICSLFEGYIDDVVTSIGRFDSRTPISVTLHDLIPLNSPKQYLDPNPVYAKYYFNKIESLKKASVFLAISNASKQEVIDSLDVDENLVVNTYEGVEDVFCVREIGTAERDQLLQRFNIKQPFVLYTGGADERKNLPRLIQAYAGLSRDLRVNHQLVFAGKISSGDEARLNNIAKQAGLRAGELIFTGYLTESELIDFYNLTKLFVFPSWHEGFGLPALEAMACGAPIIGANTTSLPEVIGWEEALFDPFDVPSIQHKLQQALADNEFQQALRAHAAQQVKKFSWDKTAQCALQTWEQVVQQHPRAVEASEMLPTYVPLINAIAQYLDGSESQYIKRLAHHLAHNQGLAADKQLLVDISAFYPNASAAESATAAQALLVSLLQNPPANFTICPVYATAVNEYCYANDYLASVQGRPATGADMPLRCQRGDVFLGLAETPQPLPSLFVQLQQQGVLVQFLTTTAPDVQAQLQALLAAANAPRKQLLVDISELVQRDAKSGIQRVVRSILHEWLTNPPAGYSVRPVYATTSSEGYWYANQFTQRFMGLSTNDVIDEAVDPRLGDVFIGLDLQSVVVPTQALVLQKWRNDGVKVWFVVYDLLPIVLKQFFPPTTDIIHNQWLTVIAQCDGVACISQAVATEFNEWLSRSNIKRQQPLAVEWFHLGADVAASLPTRGIDDNSNELLGLMQKHPAFLMVGTIEPRKGHTQVLDAFERLWQQGSDALLIIVGKEGWLIEALVKRLRNHPRKGRNLFWLEGISDEYLEKVYANASCLIAASYGEGFGLPLIEAAQKQLPIIARDIPVFREVASDYAYYFDAKNPEQLAVSIAHWIQLYEVDKNPKSIGMPWLTWKESSWLLLRSIGFH